jgi:hypothetical protein
MKRDKYIFIAVIVLILLNVASWGLIWRSNDNHIDPPFREKAPDVFRAEQFLSKKLNFNELQKNELSVSRKEHLIEIRKLRQAHRNLRETYIRMAMSPDYNSQRIDSLFSEMAKINGEMQRSTWNHFRNIYEICNDQQRKEFRRFMLRMNKLQDRVKRPPL